MEQTVLHVCIIPCTCTPDLFSISLEMWYVVRFGVWPDAAKTVRHKFGGESVSVRVSASKRAGMARGKKGRPILRQSAALCQYDIAQHPTTLADLS